MKYTWRPQIVDYPFGKNLFNSFKEGRKKRINKNFIPQPQMYEPGPVNKKNKSRSLDSFEKLISKRHKKPKPKSYVVSESPSESLPPVQTELHGNMSNSLNILI